MERRTGRDKLAKISLHTLRNLHVLQLYDRSKKISERFDQNQITQTLCKTCFE